MEISDISAGKTITVTGQLDEREYWLDKLSGEWIKSTFPYDHPKNSSPGSRQNTSFFLTGENFSALMKLSNNSQHRLFMILLAQLAVLLYKYVADTNIIVGMPICKQDKEGKFINTVLALRNTFNAGITFKELLPRVKQTVIDAVKHQNYPLEVLLQELKLPYTEEDFPLFDIAILLENIHDKDYIKPINTDMLFSFRDTGQAIAGVVEYNASRYQAATVERIITHYTHLVRHMMDAPDVPLRDMGILSEEEKNRVLYDFNDTAAGCSLHKTIHQLFAEQVELTPDNIAVVGPLQVKHRTYMTCMTYISYRELNKKSNQLAHLLRAKGVKAGMVVGILMESSIDRIIGILGILKAGAAYLPIDPEFPRRRILSILDDSSVSLLLTGEKILERLSFTSLANITAGKAGPIKTPPREQITNFDALPYPDRTLVDYQKYHRYIGEAMAKHKITLQATRGCPYNCVFCHKIWPKKHVRRSAENIFEEIMYCYNAGARRFAFIDDVFNLDIQSSSKLFRKIINKKLDLELFFCNGLRADILRKDYIDLMVEAGTVNIDVALESGSPRIQELIRKNLDLEKFYENVYYITRQYPRVILEVEMMLGFPTETEEEALMTLDLLKKLEWIHFPNLHVLKIYPTSDLAQLAVKHGIKEESIRRSTHLAFHELPETLPFSKAFAREFQTRLMEEYFLLKERLIRVLPAQARILSEDELVDKYDSYLPMEIKSFQDILDIAGISMEDLGNPVLLPKGWKEVPDFNRRIKTYYPQVNKDPDAFKVLLLDISMMFSSKKETMLHNQSDEPLGLMYLLSYLNKKFGPRVNGRIFKTGVDFDGFPRLKDIILRFRPDIIGIRTLSYYKEFFHEVVSYIRHLGVSVPIVSGGPYATSEYKLVLQDPQVDMVVLGEGELTFAELVEKTITNQKHLPDPEVLETIKGIAFIEKKDKSLLMKKANWREIIPMDRLSAEVARLPVENPTNINQPRDLLYLVSTSGSTGKPKSVMLEHRNLANLLNFQSTYTGIDFSQRVLQFASIGFDVSAQEIFSTLLSGGELNLIPEDMKTDVPRLFARITTNKISILFLPPAFLKLVFSRSEYTEGFPKTLRHIIAAGEQLVIPGALMEFLKQNRVFLHNHYGPSETILPVTTWAGDI
jgi:non-ribosomal peptide synthetase component F